MKKRVLFCVVSLFCSSQICKAATIENSDNFELYTNAPLAPEDNSANESGIMPNEAPIGNGEYLLLFFAGLYVIYLFDKAKRGNSPNKK